MIDHVDCSQKVVDPSDFFERFIAQRRPCVIHGMLLSANSSQEAKSNCCAQKITPLTAPQLQELAGDCQVEVEKRANCNSTFGQNRSPDRTVVMTVQELLAKFHKTNTNKKNSSSQQQEQEQPQEQQQQEHQQQQEEERELYYLSTQQGKWHDHFVTETLVRQEMVPSHFYLAGNLKLESINLWMGAAGGRETLPIDDNCQGKRELQPQEQEQEQQATTTTNSKDWNNNNSGLHHDFHDNFYVLHAGTKRFFLYPPQTPIPVYGKMDTLHFNGLISYQSNPTRADGVPLSLLLNEQDDDHDEDENHNNIMHNKKQQDCNKNVVTLDEDHVKIKESDKDDDDDDEEEEEEEVVIGKGFDYISSDEDSNDGENSCGDAQQHVTALTKRIAMNDDDEDEKDDSDDAVANDTENQGRKENGKETIGRPCNFSTIVPFPPDGNLNSIVLDREGGSNDGDNDNRNSFHRPLVVDLKAGQCLYLPASWFHCVFSSSPSTSSEGDSPLDSQNSKNTTVHLAVNYWYHPPDNLQSFAKPYKDYQF
ncbi:hypothetical protein ACA910_018310 [Epithemia clementina (nom. ined.)]